MLGLTLYALYQKTLKENGDAIQTKTKNIVGPWLIRHVCLTQRPWSINTYLYSKVYHKAHCIALRRCDINEIKKQTNRFLYADQLEKPGELLTYRKPREGGLGLHSIEYKCKALLIKCFLETSISPNFKHSVFHTAIYNYYVLENKTIEDPGLPPYYSQEMMDEIKWAIGQDKNVEKMSSKQWYDLLMKKYVLESEIEDENGLLSWERKKSPAELKYPDIEWENVWKLARMQGLTNEARSFLFRLLNNLHTTGSRLHRITRNHPSPLCSLCDANMEDDLQHAFTGCSQSEPSITWLTSVVSLMDPTISPMRMLQLQIEPSNKDNIRACVWLVSEGLSYIWAKRKSKEQINMEAFTASMDSKCILLKQSKYEADGTNLITLINTLPG